MWNLDTDGGGAAEITKQFGLSGDQYIVGRWADVLWQGSVDQAWDNGANWSSGSTPSSSNSVVIDQPSSSAPITLFAIAANSGVLASKEAITISGGMLSVTQPSIINNAVSIAGGSLRFDASLQADVLSMSAGSMIINVSAPLSNSNPITISGGTIFPFSAARTLPNPIALTGQLTIGGVHNLTLAGSVSGSAGLTKEGSATLILGAPNTYVGPTNINSGTCWSIASALWIQQRQ